MYAAFKHTVWGSLPLSSDGRELILGFVVFLLTLLVLRRPLNSWWAALPTVICGGVIALLDILVLGQSAPGALWDWLLFSVIAVIMTLIYRMSWAR